MGGSVDMLANKNLKVTLEVSLAPEAWILDILVTGGCDEIRQYINR